MNKKKTKIHTNYINLSLQKVLLILLITLIFQAGRANATDQQIRIGVLANRGRLECMQKWSATAVYLSRTIEGYSFNLIPLLFEEVEAAVSENRVDFVLVNPSIYVELEILHGAGRIATLKNLRMDKPYTQLGGVLFYRSDREDIAKVNDLKGKSFMGVDRIRKIVQAMKEFSHPSGDEKKESDINHAIQNTIIVSASEWKYVADLKTKLDETIPPVPCFVDEFNQVILNMIINASHAIADVVGDSGDKGTITISTRKNENSVEIRVRDSGCGIPKEIQHRIFDPFFTTKEVGKGTGQGLAIAHSVITQKHGGTIAVESMTGKGTTFVITIPLS